MRVSVPLAAWSLLLGWLGPVSAAPPDLPASPNTELARQLEAIVHGPDYRHATWGILVVDARTGDVIYQLNPDKLLAPASVTKLFSGAAALIALGPDWTAETKVYARGLNLNGVLRGDLVLVGAGDLTFGGRTQNGKTVYRDKDHTYANSGLGEAELTETDPLAGLDELARQVKDAGIRQVEGDVVIDDRLFARTRSSGSGPDAVTPVVVNDNVIDIVIEPGMRAGDAARVTTRPKTAYYQVDSLVITGPEKSAPTIRLLPLGPQHFAVRGQVGAGSRPVVRIYPVDDPVGFARALFIEALRRHGVHVQASLVRTAPAVLPGAGDYARIPCIAVYRSPPLRDVLTVTLKVSHNLYASALPCLVAAQRGDTTAEAGLREQNKILKQLGVDVGQVSFSGGAGGGPADFVTPRATVQLLLGLARRPEWEVFKSALPVLGVDGTLRDAVPADSPARGRVFAKTGTLVWYDAANDRPFLKSKALAGTMTTRKGTPLHFALFVNNVPLPAGGSPTREGRVLARLCEILYEHGP